MLSFIVVQICNHYVIKYNTVFVMDALDIVTVKSQSTGFF